MNEIRLDETKIKIFAQIQKNLCKLKKDSSNEDIDILINQIPQELLTKKDDLKVICELFALFGRLNIISLKKHVFKLFSKIMVHVKKLLQDESQFFWQIFGGNLYFKLWLYEEGLISIDRIILSALEEHSVNINYVTEFFLPEIMEKFPEVFYKQLKFKYKLPFDEESLLQFKNKRSLFIKWLKESGKYSDQIYSQIETDELRLIIKRDDLESFEKKLEEKNMTVDSTIIESTFENQFKFPTDQTLLEFSIHSESINIIKYLLSKNAKLTCYTVNQSISSHNNEIANLIKEKDKEMFQKYFLLDSVQLWNTDFFEYFTNNNHIYEYIKNMDLEQSKSFYTFFDVTVSFSNFIVFDSFILPYLKKFPDMFEKRYYKYLKYSLYQQSCFFAKQLINGYSGFNVNHIFEPESDEEKSDGNKTVLSKAIDLENSTAIEFILSFPHININAIISEKGTAFHQASCHFIDLKYIEMICNYDSFDTSSTNDSKMSVLDYALNSANFYLVEFFMKKFPISDLSDFAIPFMLSINNGRFYSARVSMKLYLEANHDVEITDFIKSIKYIVKTANLSYDIVKKVYEIADDLGYNLDPADEEDEAEEEEEVEEDSVSSDDVNTICSIC